MNPTERIKQLEEEINQEKRKIMGCPHTNKTEPIYDPDFKREAVNPRYTGRGGSDPEIEYDYRKVEVPRWSKACKDCGLKFYTYKQKAVKMEPDFS